MGNVGYNECMRYDKVYTKNILRYVALGGGIVLLSVAAPMLPYQLMKAYVRQKKFEKRRFKENVKRLHDRGLIEMNPHHDGQMSIRLLPKGEKMLERYKLEEIDIARPKKWDGVWRFILFDVPENKKHARRELSAKLRELGFYRLQKSVFLHPFPCEKEIEALGVIFGVQKYIITMHVSHFSEEEKIKRHFKLF